MSKETQEGQPIEERICKELLELLANAQAQEQAAQATHQFVSGQIVAKYQLTAQDSVDLSTGLIMRGARAAGG